MYIRDLKDPALEHISVKIYTIYSQIMMEGGIELLQYYQQQSICNNYHRYGNLGDRAWQLKDERPTSNIERPTSN